MRLWTAVRAFLARSRRARHDSETPGARYWRNLDAMAALEAERASVIRQYYYLGRIL